MAERMAAVGDALAGVVERATAKLVEIDPPTDAAGVDKLMKSVRSTALAGRGVLGLAADAARLRDAAAAGDEHGEADDDDEEERDPEGLQRLHDEIRRRCAAWDERSGEGRGDRGPAPESGGPGAPGLAVSGAEGPAPA